MSAENHSNGHAELPDDGASVLANLPRTRPQRATARRAAARRASARPARSRLSSDAGEEPKAKATVATKPKGAKAAQAAPAKPEANKTEAPKAAPAKPTGAKTEAAKSEAPKAAAPKAAAPKTATRRAASPRRERGAGTRAQTRRPVEPVPRQGFESEGDRVSGPVQPFGATELIGAATEALGEIAKAGLSGGERLLKDALSLLSR